MWLGTVLLTSFKECLLLLMKQNSHKEHWHHVTERLWTEGVLQISGSTILLLQLWLWHFIKDLAFFSSARKVCRWWIASFRIPEPSVSKRSNASLISCFCSSVRSNFLFFAPAAAFFDDYRLESLHHNVRSWVMKYFSIHIRWSVSQFKQSNKAYHVRSWE